MSSPKPRRFCTGNELVSLPEICASHCGIESISFLHRGLRATVELSGTNEIPFLQPFATIDGDSVQWGQSEWKLEEFWIPSFRLSTPTYSVTGRIVAPLGARGFVYILEFQSHTDRTLNVRAGWQGRWDQTCHSTYTAKPMSGRRHIGINQWLGTPYAEFQSHAPHFAVAFRPSELMEAEVFTEASDGNSLPVQGEGTAEAGTAVGYSIAREFEMEPEGSVAFAIHVGLGLEEISAASSAADLHRTGHEQLLTTALAWLRKRSLRVRDRELEDILNRNLFFSYFFGQGITLDTEELAVVTSRSSRYPLTAAYCDRDALLWNLPAALYVEPRQARQMLEYAFTVQIRNVGIHSRFVDGVVLEPGFELDELCAPIYALWRYVRATGDMSMLFDRRIQAGINQVQEILARKKHPTLSLYETSLLPSDDVAMYPYVIFDNVMVWRMLNDLASVYDRIGDLDRKDDTLDQARKVKAAINEHAIVDGPFGKMFAWSVDLKGNHRLADNPQGSLQLLPYLEFCSADLEYYKNTLKWIRSKENPGNAPHAGRERTSLFTVANELLVGSAQEALEFLRRSPLDHGLCCEFADTETGEALSGRGYASCAGLVAYAMAVALGVEIPESEDATAAVTPHFRLS